MGIGKDEDGDRLTPIEALLEDREFSSNETNQSTYKRNLIQNFEYQESSRRRSSNVHFGELPMLHRAPGPSNPILTPIRNDILIDVESNQLNQESVVVTPFPGECENIGISLLSLSNREPVTPFQNNENIKNNLSDSPHPSINVKNHGNENSYTSVGKSLQLVENEEKDTVTSEEPLETYEVHVTPQVLSEKLNANHEVISSEKSKTSHDGNSDDVFEELCEADQKVSWSVTRHKNHCVSCTCNRISLKLKHPVLLRYLHIDVVTHLLLLTNLLFFRKYQSLSQYPHAECYKKDSEREFVERNNQRNSYPGLDGSGLICGQKKNNTTSDRRASVLQIEAVSGISTNV